VAEQVKEGSIAQWEARWYSERSMTAAREESLGFTGVTAQRRTSITKRHRRTCTSNKNINPQACGVQRFEVSEPHTRNTQCTTCYTYTHTHTHTHTHNVVLHTCRVLLLVMSPRAARFIIREPGLVEESAILDLPFFLTRVFDLWSKESEELLPVPVERTGTLTRALRRTASELNEPADGTAISLLLSLLNEPTDVERVASVLFCTPLDDTPEVTASIDEEVLAARRDDDRLTICMLKEHQTRGTAVRVRGQVSGGSCHEHQKTDRGDNLDRGSLSVENRE
jgi:hypothetical protein